MRLPFICIIIFFASTSLFSQSSDWSLNCYSSLDAPFKHYTADNVDPKGSTITPTANFGQFFYLERNFTFNKGFGFLVGGGMGYSNISADIISTNEFQNKPSSRDHSFDFFRENFDYISVYAGSSYSKLWKENLTLQLSFKIGVFKISAGKSSTGSFISQENDESLQVVEASFRYNESDEIFLMLFPEAKLTYKFKKLPLGLTVA